MADAPSNEVQALNNPHQLFLVDRVLKMDVGAFVSHVTLGNTAPNGQLLAVASITASTDALYSVAMKILEAIANQTPKIKADHLALQKKLEKLEKR